MKIIYIAGDGRSGSTLLDAALSNTPDSISIGEGYRFWQRFYEADTLCGCSEKIEVCPMWSSIDKKLSEEIHTYNPIEMWEKITFLLKFKNVKRAGEIIQGEEWQDFKKAVRLFYQQISELTGKSIIVDSSKSIGWLYLLTALEFKSLKVIHLERNLQAVANSWKKKVTLPEYYDSEVFMPIKNNGLIFQTRPMRSDHGRGV